MGKAYLCLIRMARKVEYTRQSKQQRTGID